VELRLRFGELAWKMAAWIETNRCRLSCFDPQMGPTSNLSLRVETANHKACRCDLTEDDEQHVSLSTMKHWLGMIAS
jgi:hypothetical protein